MNSVLRKLLFVCAFALCGAAFTACSDDETNLEPLVPELSVTAEGLTWCTAEATVQANNIVELYYLVQKAGEAAPTEALVFANGVKVQGPHATETVTVEGLEATTDYTIYVAGYCAHYGETTDGIPYGQVVSASFQTTYYTEDVTVLDVYADGFKVHVKVPEDVDGTNAVVKWGVTNSALYTYQNVSEAEFTMLNDQAYPNAILTGDKILDICEENRYAKDENGKYVYDEWSGEPVYYWDIIAPGEPLYLLLCKYTWGESMWGWGEGWYTNGFDYDGYNWAMEDYYWGMTDEAPSQDDFWVEGSWHKKIAMKSTEPTPYAESVDVNISNLGPTNATVSLVPTENCFAYTFMLLDEATYQQVTSEILGGDESLWQWFTTSYVAMYLVGSMTYYGSEMPPMIALNEHFYGVGPGNIYHILAVAMDGSMSVDEFGDEMPAVDPTKQSFVHKTVQLPDFSTEAPELTVTGLEPTDAWKVRFNVKSTGTEPVVSGSYAMNYVREFEQQLSYGYTYTDLCKDNYDYGYAVFNEEELALINSAEGYTMEFDSRENTQSRLAVMGWNAEGRPSNPDAEGSKAVADAWSGVQPDADPIASEYYESLVGSWTATATVQYQKYNSSTWSYDAVEAEMSSTVTIGDLTVPETLTDDVYAVFEDAGVSKDETDAYFAELKEQTANFNKKTRGQNRILCTGWGFDSNFIKNPSYSYSAMRTATPWDLFIATGGYSAADISSLFYDFGPKWYLQVAADKSLFVPVNSNRMSSMTSWYDGQDYYLTSGNYNAGIADYTVSDVANMDDVTKWPNIPVEVSEDGNTITLKARTVQVDGNDVELYPTVVYNSSWYGLTFYNTAVVSEVVLTRNTEAAPEETVDVAALRQHAAAAAAAKQQGVKVQNGDLFRPMKQTLKGRTPFVKGEKKAFRKVDAKAVTAEQFKENLLKLRQGKLVSK